MSGDAEFARFDFRQRQFPPANLPQSVEASLSGLCAGVAQWMRLELDDQTQYENRPSPDAEFSGHWAHMLHRFPQLTPVKAGEMVPIMFRHDRSQITLDLIE